MITRMHDQIHKECMSDSDRESLKDTIFEKADHRNSVNAMAEAPSATAACHIRESMIAEPSAALWLALAPIVELAADDDDDVAGLEVAVVLAVSSAVVGRVRGVEVGGTDVVISEVPDADDASEAEPGGVEGFAPAPAGGGTAVEGSTSAPTPQGIAAFVPGWLGFAGGVVAPVGDAIVKRVVHVLSAARGEVNW
jgi:hypothetical protein